LQSLIKNKEDNDSSSNNTSSNTTTNSINNLLGYLKKSNSLKGDLEKLNINFNKAALNTTTKNNEHNENNIQKLFNLYNTDYNGISEENEVSIRI